MISLIFAMGNNKAIGYKNQMPWHLPADLAFFKKITMGKPVIMGRKTFESLGRPLPGRTNVVITRNKELTHDGCVIVDSIDSAKEFAKYQDCFIIGGAEIYAAFLQIADRMYITEINDDFEADTFFPEIDYSKWKLVSSQQGIKDEKNPYDYKHLVYEKKV